MCCYIIIQGETHHNALALIFKIKIQANYKLANTKYFTSIFLSKIRTIYSDTILHCNYALYHSHLLQYAKQFDAIHSVI